jgi:hypothetical protein
MVVVVCGDMVLPRPVCQLTTAQTVLRAWQRQRLSAGAPFAAWRGWGAPLAAQQDRGHSLSCSALEQAERATTAPLDRLGPLQPPPSPAHHQTVDYTTLAAVAHELRQTLCPSKVSGPLSIQPKPLPELLLYVGWYSHKCYMHAARALE